MNTAPFYRTIASECPKPVSYVQEGVKTPCTGYLFSPSSEKQVRLVTEELDYTKELIKHKDNIIAGKQAETDILEKRITLYQEGNAKLADKITDLNSSSFWNNFLYFTLGVVATSASTYVIYQSIKQSN